MPGMTRIWIQGAGELASGVAWRLLRCGYAVTLAEIPNPLSVRRLVCFSEAVHEGCCQVEGMPGVLVPRPEAPRPSQAQVVIDPHGACLEDWVPVAVIDARMTKQAPRTLPVGPALRVGLGPGFTCGLDTDLIVETHREARLGEVLEQGSASPNTGIPGRVGGQSSRRVVYATVAGNLDPLVAIGDLVSEGSAIGTINGETIYANLAGRVRGLIHPRTELSAGTKVADVDPRGMDADPGRLTDKALAVAGGVLEALLGRGIHPGCGNR